MSDNAPGWQPDPTGTHDHRYWDGSQWTDNVSDGGVASTDAYEPAVSAVDATVADTPVVAADAPAPPPPDATAAWPTASDAPASWPTTPGAPGAPAPPPPYVPTNPVSSGGGGSKKGLLVGGGILAAVAIAVVAFLALGGGDDESVRTQLASTLQRESNLSDSDAECVADFFVDELGEDAFDGVDFDAAEAPKQIDEAFTENGPAAIEKCNIDESAFGGTTDTTEGSTDTTDGSGEEGSYGSDPEFDALYDDCKDGDYAACDELFFSSPTGSEYEAFGDTCGERNEPSGECVALYEDGGGDSGGLTDSAALPDNFEEILADTYEETFDLSREKAECLAGNLTNAIEDGSLDQEQVMTDFLDYLADCDISMEEIGGN